MIPILLILASLTGSPIFEDYTFEWEEEVPPTFGEYRFEPSIVRTREWVDLISDSLREDRPSGFRVVLSDPDGNLVGHDTLTLRKEGQSIHSHLSSWEYGKDTSHSLVDEWSQEFRGAVDSLRSISFYRGKWMDNVASWSIPTEEGTLRVFDHSPGSSLDYRDSIHTRFDAEGRFTYRRFLEYRGVRSIVDSVEWKGKEPAMWWRITRNGSTGVSEEWHYPTWDGLHLVRDSTIIRITSAQGITPDSSWVRSCSWDRERFRKCIDVRDSSIRSFLEWDQDGRVLKREMAPNSILDKGITRISAWNWDLQGRLVKKQLQMRARYVDTTIYWGIVDSLFYGEGMLPESSVVIACEPLESDTIAKDSCKRDIVRSFSYPFPNPSRVSRTSPARGLSFRSRNGMLRISSLEKSAARVSLRDLSGRTLMSANVERGEAAFNSFWHRGLVIWVVYDASGKIAASGALPLP